MRKIAIAMLLFLMSGISTLSAQSQGDKYFGSLLGMSISQQSTKDGSTKEKGNPALAFEAAPGLQYFIADRFRIGLHIDMSTQSQKQYDGSKDVINALACGPSCAYYFQLADKLYFTPELGFYFAMVNYKNKNDVNKYDNEESSGFIFAFHPAMLEFRPTDHFGFSVSIIGLECSSMKPSGTSERKASSTGFVVGVSPTIGFKYYF